MKVGESLSTLTDKEIIDLSKLAVNLGKLRYSYAGHVDFLKQLATMLNAESITIWFKFQGKTNTNYYRLFSLNTTNMKLVHDEKILEVNDEIISQLKSSDYHKCSLQCLKFNLFFQNEANEYNDIIIFSIDAELLYFVYVKKQSTLNIKILRLIAELLKKNKNHLLAETVKYAHFFSFISDRDFESKEVFFSMDANDYSLLGVSPSIEYLTGLKPETLIKVPISQLFLYYNENSIKDLVRQTLKTGSVKNFYIEVIDSEDNIKYCTIDAKLNQTGSKKVIEGIISDKTDYFLMKQERDRLQSKINVLSNDFRRFEVAIENNPLGIIFCNLKGEITYANLSFLRMTLYNYKEVVGKTPAILKSGFHEKEFYNKMWRSIKNGFVWSSEVYDKKKNGQNFWATLIISPIRNEKGILKEFIAIYEDIDKKKEMENMLTRARMEAESANQAKSEFLATMSHEIRNPLNALVGNIEFLSKTKLNDNQAEIVRRTLVSSESLLHIINDILDFSKIESGQLVIERKPFNLKEMFFDLVRTMEPKIKQKKLTLHTEFDKTLDIAIIGDKFRLMQILLNLLNNAVKFTSQGYIRISCINKPVSNTKSVKVLFEVEDTGIGIAKDKIKSVFDKFKQEDQSITRKYGGTGLGLAISKQLTQLMGGDLFVESIKNKGSKFYFVLEFEKSIKQKHSTDDVDFNNLDKPDILKGKKILVVDDLEFNVDVATMLLKSWGATCYTAFNGEEAIELLKNNSDIDMVLMDFRMPVMDGINATKFIRQELNLSIPVIGLTGEVVKEKIDESISAGMNDYLTKPFKRKNLLLKLLKHLK